MCFYAFPPHRMPTFFLDPTLPTFRRPHWPIGLRLEQRVLTGSGWVAFFSERLFETSEGGFLTRLLFKVRPLLGGGWVGPGRIPPGLKKKPVSYSPITGDPNGVWVVTWLHQWMTVTVNGRLSWNTGGWVSAFTSAANKFCGLISSFDMVLSRALVVSIGGGEGVTRNVGAYKK